MVSGSLLLVVDVLSRVITLGDGCIIKGYKSWWLIYLSCFITKLNFIGLRFVTIVNIPLSGIYVTSVYYVTFFKY